MVYDHMYVYYSGTANSTTLNGGHLYVSSGGTANSTTVNSSGHECSCAADRLDGNIPFLLRDPADGPRGLLVSATAKK